MAVQFIIDSASDILPGEARELGLIHLPLTVLFGEETYRDAVDLTHEGFYEKLVENDVLPTTSQIPPGDFAAAYEKVVEAGDEAVVITLSGKLSGTHQSAVIAAEEYEGRVYVVDSGTIAIGLGILTEYALELADRGMTAQEIVRKLQRKREDIRLLALVDTLEYLKKGGRISSMAAVAGGLLNIKPVLTIQNG